jgi:DNA-binding PadR family transcriptional regulator
MQTASGGQKVPKAEERFLALFLIWRLRKQPMYGYTLAEEIRDMGISPRRQSTVYAILSRLEDLGFIKSRSKTVGKRIRKMYDTTSKGAEFFERVKTARIKGALRGFMEELVS